MPSTADIDKTISHGLGIRWSFMGPFETIDLNAPGGVRDYAERLGDLYLSIAKDRTDPQPWSDALIGAVEKERRAELPVGELGAAQPLARSPADGACRAQAAARGRGALVTSFRLDGKFAVVTGASRGLGLGCAIALAEAGADVGLVARPSDSLDEAVEMVRALGRNAVPLPLDVRDRHALQAGLESLEAIDILVNNAGTNVPQHFLDVEEAAFDEVVDINLKAAFFTAQAAARRMVARGTGVIINMTSQAGHVALPKRTVYCTTKFGLEGLTKAMALDLKGTGVRVNALAPTFVETPLTAPFLANEEFRRYVDSMLLVDRLATPEDVGAAVVFLASDAAALVNGASLLVDGGWTAH